MNKLAKDLKPGDVVLEKIAGHLVVYEVHAIARHPDKDIIISFIKDNEQNDISYMYHPEKLLNVSSISVGSSHGQFLSPTRGDAQWN
jgi:hypothetical protein